MPQRFVCAKYWEQRPSEPRPTRVSCRFPGYRLISTHRITRRYPHINVYVFSSSSLNVGALQGIPCLKMLEGGVCAIDHPCGPMGGRCSESRPGGPHLGNRQQLPRVRNKAPDAGCKKEPIRYPPVALPSISGDVCPTGLMCCVSVPRQIMWVFSVMLIFAWPGSSPESD